MKNIFNRALLPLLIVTVLLTACEQENYQPNFTVAPGGGTVTTYKAYTLASSTAANINGRIVFYKYSKSVTLVQVGLYNTAAASNYSAAIYTGKIAGGSPTKLVTLYDVSGATGAFGTSKFFTITTDGFFDALTAYNANVKIQLAATTVSQGDIGANAAPVAESE